MTHTVVVRAPEVRTSVVVRGVPGPAGPDDLLGHAELVGAVERAQRRSS